VYLGWFTYVIAGYYIRKLNKDRYRKTNVMRHDLSLVQVT
jgi:hypothetical protein